MDYRAIGGRKLDKFISQRVEMGKKIGEGAMGKVFLASYLVHPKTRKRISAAVKQIPAAKMDLQEVELLSKLSQHPKCNKYVACHYDLMRDRKTRDYYIVMEFINGKELWDYLVDRSTPLGLHEMRRFMRQALEGMVYIHGKGIAHGDIKLENVMVDESDSKNHRIKFIDFGYGCSKETCNNSPVLHGTSYLDPPEAFSHETPWSIDLRVPKHVLRRVPKPDGAKTLDGIQRADLWALGSMFVEMITYDGKTLKRTMDMGMSGKQLENRKSKSWLAAGHLKKRGKRRSKAFGRLYAVIDGLMKIDPDDRFTAKQALRVLK